MELVEVRFVFTFNLTCFLGGLKDTIAHFTENLAPNEWKKAVQNARKCDVALVLGTSMNVQPAASLPVKALANENGKVRLFLLEIYCS